MSSRQVINTFKLSANIAKKGPLAAITADRERIEKFRKHHSPHGPKRSEHVRRRIKHEKPFASAETPSIDVTDTGVTYTMPVQIGNGNYTLLYVVRLSLSVSRTYQVPGLTQDPRTPGVVRSPATSTTPAQTPSTLVTRSQLHTAQALSRARNGPTLSSLVAASPSPTRVSALLTLPR